MPMITINYPATKTTTTTTSTTTTTTTPSTTTTTATTTTTTTTITRTAFTSTTTIEDLEEVGKIKVADNAPTTAEKSYYTAFIFVLFLCMMIVSVFGLIGYAYFRPNSVTGRLLIKVICVFAFI
jgi:hypothetical protein